MGKKIVPWLWFDGNAEEAVNYYLSVFPDASISESTHYPEGTPMAGQVLTITFRLFDQEFGAINAGPEFRFNEAVSFQIECEDQQECDYYWDSLTANGGEESMCGWLKDRYGLSWQIVPRQFTELMAKASPAQASAMFEALMSMRRLDVAAFQRAYDAA
ncbi:MAG: VOC family protein [Thermomicrobiales bacterium]